MKTPETYNDGIVNIYRKKEENLTTNRNVSRLDDLEHIIQLAYKELSRRQQDLEFADQKSFSLAMKIKTPRPPVGWNLDTHCYAVIEHVLYSIQYIDTNHTEYFLYLEKVRVLEEKSDGLE